MKNLVQRKLTWLCLSLFSHHQSSSCFSNSNSNDFIKFLIFGFKLIEIGWVWFKIQFNSILWRLIKLKLNSISPHVIILFWIQLKKMVNSSLKSNPIQLSLINFNLVKLNWILWVESISWKFRKHSHQMVNFLVDYYHDVKNFLICNKMKWPFVLLILSWGKKCVDIMKCQQILLMVIK